MSHQSPTLPPPTGLDYSLTGINAKLAIEKGLAEADWYQTPIPRTKLRSLLHRRNGPALRGSILWFALLGLTAWGTIALWGTWWVVVPYLAYGAGAKSRKNGHLSCVSRL